MESVIELEKAEADLLAARVDLEQASRRLEKAELEVAEALRAEEARRHFTVEVLYDGVKQPFEVRLDEKVKTLLEEAIKRFGPFPRPHTLSLFTAGGKELEDAQTIEQAGLKPQDVLLLRPSAVKGGA